MQQDNSNHLPDWLQAVKSNASAWDLALSRSSPEITNVRTLRRGAVSGYQEVLQGWMADKPTWFVTITHAYHKTHWEQSLRSRRRWLNDLNRRLFGSHFERRGEGLISFFSFEYQKRGTVHQHGLIAGDVLADLRRDKEAAVLAGFARGFCKIERPRGTDRSIKYCTKYVAKDGDVDWWLPGSLRSSLR